MSLFGFTLLRNGVKYDYPFLESLRSLSALCEKVYVALGASDDGTAEKLGEFSNLVIIPTVWDENLRQSGLILSQQTNIALARLREEHPRGWGIYLQADEVLHEGDFPQIRADALRALEQGCDALSFRYLHFWQSYHRVAVDRRWYPQEVRAIRLDSAAESWGDAQGFRPVQKKYETEAVVYHYGHIREAKAYERKKADFNRWWHSDAEMAQVLRKGAKRDVRERAIPYFGPQPSFMAARIGSTFRPEGRRKVVVYGRPEDYPGLAGRVHAELEWTLDLRRALRHPIRDTVLLHTLPIWARYLPWASLRSQVPESMGSPQARPWTPEYVAMLKFSEKEVYVS